ncbi:alpha/beta hydrolase [Herbaspirillum sp. HC18]|nr:alpha/beta hydrolase [Herbaspirillum sp. HC18]
MATNDEIIDIAVDGERIAGTIVTSDTRLPGVLFVHGWGGSREQYLARAREVTALGCVCLAFDLRGHAETKPQQATVSREKNLRDVLAAYDTLARHRAVDSSAIAVVGSSYGGYLAAILTTLRPVKWLALRAPALYMDNGWELPKLQLHKEQDLGAYRRSLVPAENNRALHSCSKFEGDILLIESENDHVIPHEVICNYRDACMRSRSLTYRVIEEADHGLSEERWQRAYTALLMGWMTEMVLGARHGNEPAQAETLAGSALPEAPPQPG